MKIRYKMILFLLGTVILTIAPISYFTLENSQKVVIETTYDLCKNLSENISEISREELFIDSTYEASSTVVARLKNSKLRGLIDIKLMNVSGNYVVRFNSEDKNEPSESEIADVRQLKLLSYFDKKENNKNILRFISPVFLSKKSESFMIGATIFDFDKDLLFYPITEIKNRIIVISTMVLFISMLGAIFFSYLFTKPIASLSDGVKIISDGNYDYQIQIKSKDEIGEFAKSFNQMTYNIKMANKAKDEFLANLSHELKTPLTTIFGYSEMLMMGNNEVEEVIEYSKEIHAGSQKLNDYVNDLILLTDIETNISPNIGLIDINQVIDVEIEKQKNLIEEKEIILEYTNDYSLTLEGDIELLSKAISAILKNAIIYNKQKGKVIVCVVVNNENLPQNLEIKISDTGIGIAEEFQEKVFDKFFRIDSSLLYEVSGVGIGLFIAKKIIELHNGKIKLQSKLGLGTEVSILLPMSERDTKDL